MLFYRNILVNYFPPLMKDMTMCQAVEEVLNPHAPLFRNLQDNLGHMSSSVHSSHHDSNKVRWLNKISDKIK